MRCSKRISPLWRRGPLKIGLNDLDKSYSIARQRCGDSAVGLWSSLLHAYMRYFRRTQSPLSDALVGFSADQMPGSRAMRLEAEQVTRLLLDRRLSQKSKLNLKRDQMKANDLRSMSVDELWTLHEEISSVLAKRLAEEKAALEERLRRLRPGSETGTFRRAKRPYPQVLPKFRNPAQPAETWSGRGKQPRWLTAQLRSGKKLNDFLIQSSSNRARRSSSMRKQRRA